MLKPPRSRRVMRMQALRSSMNTGGDRTPARSCGAEVTSHDAMRQTARSSSRAPFVQLVYPGEVRSRCWAWTPKSVTTQVSAIEWLPNYSGSCGVTRRHTNIAPPPFNTAGSIPQARSFISVA